MFNNKHILAGPALVLCILVVGSGLFAWPNYQAAGDARKQIIELETRISGLGDQTQLVEELAVEVSEARRNLDTELKIIPESAAIASLVRELSWPVDGTTIMDQTFTKGASGSAILGDDDGALVMPVTVDMVARFDSIFALIQAVESMDRLVRVTSVRIACDRTVQAEKSELFVTASIALESVYEPANDS